MSYKEMAREAKKNKQTRKLNTEYLKFEKKGDSITGCLLATVEAKGKKNQGKYFQYVFDTDDGPLKCAFGSAFDKMTLPLLHQGGVYSITYLGKDDIGGGHSVNRFDVLELGVDPAIDVEEEAGE